MDFGGLYQNHHRKPKNGRWQGFGIKISTKGGANNAPLHLRPYYVRIAIEISVAPQNNELRGCLFCRVAAVAQIFQHRHHHPVPMAGHLGRSLSRMRAHLCICRTDRIQFPRRIRGQPVGISGHPGRRLLHRFRLFKIQVPFARTNSHKTRYTTHRLGTSP